MSLQYWTDLEGRQAITRLTAPTRIIGGLGCLALFVGVVVGVTIGRWLFLSVAFVASIAAWGFSMFAGALIGIFHGPRFSRTEMTAYMRASAGAPGLCFLCWRPGWEDQAFVHVDCAEKFARSRCDPEIERVLRSAKDEAARRVPIPDPPRVPGSASGEWTAEELDALRSMKGFAGGHDLPDHLQYLSDLIADALDSERRSDRAWLRQQAHRHRARWLEQEAGIAQAHGDKDRWFLLMGEVVREREELAKHLWVAAPVTRPSAAESADTTMSGRADS
jgi:hypothetical protein